MAEPIIPSNSPPSQPSRRAILARLATVSVAAAVPVDASAVDIDPHPEWARLAREIADRLDTAGDIPDKESDLWCDRMNVFHDLIIDTPARTFAGAREQLAYVQWSIEANCPGERERTALANALATLDRLPGGQVHV